MNAKPRAILDTGAVMAFAHEVSAVGEALAEAADMRAKIWLPSTCLIEAYSLLDIEEQTLVRLLRGHPNVEVVQPVRVERGDDFPGIGGMARHTGRLGAGHAAFLALATAATVITSRADQVRKVLGEGWHIIEVLSP